MRINGHDIAIDAKDLYVLLRELTTGDTRDVDLVALRKNAPALTEAAFLSRIYLFAAKLNVPEGHEHYVAEGFSIIVQEADNLRQLSYSQLSKSLYPIPPAPSSSTLELFEQKVLKMLRRSPKGFVGEEFGHFVNKGQEESYEPWLDVKPLTQKWPRDLLESPAWSRVESPVPGIPDQPLEDTWVNLTLRELNPRAPQTIQALEMAAWGELQFDREGTGVTPHEILLKVRGLSVIAGLPGAGKSTLMKWLARHVVLEPHMPFGIPVFISLRQYAKAKRLTPQLSLLEYFLRAQNITSASQIEHWKILHNGLVEAYLHDDADGSAFLWLLDGWDELPEDQRDLIIPDIEAISLFPSIITTRYSGNPLRLPAEHYYEIQGLKHNDALELAHRWLTSVGREAHFAAIEIGLEESRELRRMARSPFLLTLICALATDPTQTSRPGWGWLPSHRGAVLGSTLELIYAQHNQDSKQQEKFTRGDKEDIGRFSFWLLSEAKDSPRYVFDQSDYALCTSSTGRFEALLVPSRLIAQTAFNTTDFQFLHASFQEYLAAENILHMPAMIPHWETLILNQTWQEVARFLAEIGDAASEARKSLWTAVRTSTEYLDRFGIMASRIALLLSAAGERDGGVQLLGIDIREQLWMVLKAYNYQVPTQPLEAFLALDAADFARRALDDFMEHGKDASLVSWLELVSVFDLEPLTEDDTYREVLKLPQVLTFLPEEIQRMLLGETDDDALEDLPDVVARFNQVMQTRDYEGARSLFWEMISQYMFEYTYEIVHHFAQFPATIADNLLFEIAIADNVGSLTRAEAVINLMKVSGRDACARLLVFLASVDENDERIMPILGNIAGYLLNFQEIQLVKDFLKHADPETRCVAAEALAGTRSRDVAAHLIQALFEEQDEEVRRTILAQLEEMAVDTALEELWNLRNMRVLKGHDDWYGWFRAVLAATEKRQIRTAIFGKKENRDALIVSVREWALKSLAAKGDKSVSYTLDAVLHYPKILGASAWGKLITLANAATATEATRIKAILGVARLGDNTDKQGVAGALKTIATNGQIPETIRKAACEALGDVAPAVLIEINSKEAEEVMAKLAYRRNLLFMPQGILRDANGRSMTPQRSGFAEDAPVEDALVENAPVDEVTVDYRQLKEHLSTYIRQFIRKDDIGLEVSRGINEKDASFVEKAAKLIKDHITYNVNDLADEMNYMPGSLRRKFRQHTHGTFTPRAFILAIRMEEAKKLLEQGFSVTRVTLEVGYADRSYFADQFETFVGVRPSTYQKQYKAP